MKRNRGVLLLLTVVFAFLSVLYYGRDITYIALGFGLPGVLSLIYYIYLPKNMQCRLKMDAYYSKNDSVSGEMLLKRKGAFPVFYGKAFFQIENMLTGELEDFELDISLLGKKEKSLKFDFRVKHAGVVSVAIKRVEVYSLLGCFKKELGIQKNRNFMVLPEAFEIPIKLSPVYCLHEEGEKTIQSRNGFDSGIYYGVREYREGDSMKHIHWKLTGKTDDYLVKELGVPALLLPVLYLETNLEENSPDLIDALVEVYVSLSLQMVEEGYRHTMCWYDERKMDFVWHSIEDMDQLEEVLSLILKTPFTYNEKPHFFRIPSEEWSSYGQIIILANQLARYQEAMARDDALTILYGREKKDKKIKENNIYPFGVATFRKDLDMLYL